ncbi:hypothetical protein [Pedobacter steynii]
MKKPKKSGHDADKAMARAGSVNLSEDKKLQTDEPLAEKDEENKRKSGSEKG